MEYFIYSCFFLTMLVAFFFYIFISISEKAYLKSGLKEYEFFDIYTYTKREFNLNPFKNLTEMGIIEKCGNVNNIWNGLPQTTKINITEWAVVFALYHISKNNVNSPLRLIDLIKLKYKYRNKYLLIQLIVR